MWGEAAPSTATLTVTKVVTNNNGGTMVVNDFPLFLDGMSISSGVATTTSAGLHTISETNQTGYSATITGDCASDGMITLAGGDNKACTITNDDQTGHLTIVKNTVGGDGSFDFTVSGPTASAPTVVASSLSGTTGSVSVNTGTYSVAETGQAGWDLTSASCNDGSSSLSGNTISGINIPLNGNVTCTFTNTKRGSITVHKDVVAPNGTTDVSDTHEFTVTLDGSNQQKFAEGSSYKYENLAPGTYTVAEITGDPDFDLLRISGDDEENNPVDGALITVTAGQDTDVTITNSQKQAHLTVIKHVVNHSIGTAVAGDFTINISEGTPSSPSSFSGSEDGTLVTLDPGSYSITETGPDGYAMSQTSGCSGTMTSNGTATCTITNSDIPTGQGAITVVKNIVNNYNGGSTAVDFTLKIADASEHSTTTPSGTAQFLDPGSYVVSEDDPTSLGYTQTSISCTNGTDTTSDGSVTLGDQDAWVCTVTNNDLPGTLHVIKNIINDNGGSAAASDFSFLVNEDEEITVFEADGQNDLTVAAGTYSIEEALDSRYTTTYEYGEMSDCSSIEIANGGEATCTITNNDKPAHLTIVKRTDEQSGDGTFDFNITGVEGTTSLTTIEGSASTEPIELNASSYDVTESVPENWNLSSVVCERGETSIGEGITNGKAISLNNGDSVTCTFTDTKRATLTVKKVVVNDNGRTKIASDFSFKVNDGDATTFTAGENNLLGENSVVVNAGTYNVTEPAVSDYTTTYENCSDIVLANGGSATCTITNNDTAPPQDNPPTPPTPPAPNGPIAGAFGASVGSGSVAGGSVLGEEISKEEQIKKLKEQIQELRQRLAQLLRGQIDSLRQQIIEKIRTRIADLQAQIRQIQQSR
jgi:hypothetical protein